MEGRTVPTRTLAYMCSGTSPDASVIVKTEEDIFFFSLKNTLAWVFLLELGLCKNCAE